jgi:hypothetical protein
VINKDCRRCLAIRCARYGRLKLQGQAPDYLQALEARLDGPSLMRLLANVYKNRYVVFPLPSALFPGLDPGLDPVLKRHGREKDVALCAGLAQIAIEDQDEYLRRALRDRAQADRWARTPRWQRPLLAGDPVDRVIWQFFVMQRLNMEQAAADAPPWSMASQGAQLCQMAGALEYIVRHGGGERLAAVLSTYGWMLRDGRDLGDVVHPPWSQEGA